MNKITRFVGKYDFLSNFASCTVFYEEDAYPSVECAFQAAKTLNKEERIFFQVCDSGKDARREGRKVTLREDWDQIKLAVMEDLVRQKFNDPGYSSKLIQTGDAFIEEGNSWGDVFWGTCNGTGENHLGKILMKIRSELNDSKCC